MQVVGEKSVTYRLTNALLFVFVLMRVQGASAAEAIQASFDCTKAATLIEKAICGDADLAAEDRKMAVAFQEVIDAAPKRSRAAITDSQRRWLKGLSERCSSAAAMSDCVGWRYRDWLRDEPRKLANVERVMAMVVRSPMQPTLSLDKNPGLCRRLENAAINDFEQPGDIDEDGGWNDQRAGFL